MNVMYETAKNHNFHITEIVIIGKCIDEDDDRHVYKEL